MTWATRFRIREYLRESLWVVPSLGAVMGVLGAAVLISIDSHLKVPSNWAYSSSTASTVLSAIEGAEAALTGFVVTVTVLVVQMASGSYGTAAPSLTKDGSPRQRNLDRSRRGVRGNQQTQCARPTGELEWRYEIWAQLPVDSYSGPGIESAPSERTQQS
jgi:Predicted membrane protein (DUF2254)